MDFEEGRIATSVQEAAQLEHAGWTKCHNQLCDWWISPEAVEQTVEAGQQYKCPRCTLTYDLNTVVGQYPRKETSQFAPGGTTISGLSLAAQAQIGEDLIEKMGHVPGYGQIVWWHQGGATAKSPLDGAVEDLNGGTWGIEVKAVNADAKNLRFIPGGPKYKQMKNNHAEREGWRGILGVLVMLNYRTSKADIYIREMPLEPWIAGNGKTVQGVAAFRHKDGIQVIGGIPFDNPLVNPNDPSPNVYGTPSAFAGQQDDIPL